MIASRADEWRAQRIDTPARVSALEAAGGPMRICAGGLWYALVANGDAVALKFIAVRLLQ